MKFLRQNSLRLAILLSLIVISIQTGREFHQMHIVDPIYPNPCEIRLLSDYFPTLKGTAGDTDVYLFEGDSPGATILILGGTHANEPAGMIAATCLIENISVETGRLFILPRANNSGFTHNDPQEGNPQSFTIRTTAGERSFRYGSRYTNPIDQWPDPIVYEHFPSGQRLSAAETRNLNRSYPGRPDGNLTEQIGFGIVQLLQKESVDIAIDMHEASLEYPVINALVAHQLAFDLAAEAVLYLQFDDIHFNLEPSPEEFRGLSHREWGDKLGIQALLMESANPLQGRYHGKVTAETVTSGLDKYNMEAAHSGLIEVEYPDTGIPLDLRVARHLAGLNQIFTVWNSYNENKINITDLPEYDDVLEQGIGAFLKQPTGER